MNQKYQGINGASRLIALTVACAMFMAQLDASVVLVALPAMGHSFNVHAIDLSPGVTVYILVQAVLLPSSNWLAERLGARRVFVAALVCFSVASIACGASQTLPQFIAARILQGAAAALMAPVARIIQLQATPKEHLVAALAISTIPMLLAPTLGPAVGGLITTYLSWRWIFFLNIPFGVLAIILARLFLPDVPGKSRRAFDAVGFVLVAAGIVGVLSGLDWISENMRQWAPAALLVAGGLFIGALALRHLWSSPHPIVSLQSSRIKTYFVTTLGGGTLIRLPVRAAAFILPLFFEFEFGYTAFQAGIMMLAMNGGDLVLKFVTTQTLRRYGFRTVVLGSAVATLLLIAMTAGFSGSIPFWLMIAVLAACGMARSLLFTGTSTLAFADVPAEEMGSAAVLWNMAQQIMNALAISIAALTLNLVAAASGEPVGYVGRFNCQIALLLTVALGALSLRSLRTLPADAGAALSGHSATD